MKGLPEKPNGFLVKKESKQTKYQAFSGTAENYDFVHKTLNNILRTF